MVSRSILTTDAPEPIGPYSQAVQWEKLIFTAGQVPLRPDGSFVDSGVADQTDQALRNLQAILEAAGASLATVVKTTIFLMDMNDFAEVNTVYGRYFSGNKPARSTVQVAGLPKDARVEIEAIAYIP